jgi:hypothetical protein
MRTIVASAMCLQKNATITSTNSNTKENRRDSVPSVLFHGRRNGSRTAAGPAARVVVVCVAARTRNASRAARELLQTNQGNPNTLELRLELIVKRQNIVILNRLHYIAGTLNNPHHHSAHVQTHLTLLFELFLRMRSLLVHKLRRCRRSSGSGTHTMSFSFWNGIDG